MPQCSPEQIDHYARSVERAKAVLGRGDVVSVGTCGGRASYTFKEWDDQYPGFFISKSGITELHPYNITKVNGKEVSFRDPGHIEESLRS